MKKSFTFVVKVYLLGEGAVGKTTLREQYLGKGFKSTYLPTIGADFAINVIEYENIKIRFQIWDLAGQARFTKVRSIYYKESKGFLLVYDITRRETLQKCHDWILEMKTIIKDTSNIPIMLIGNKIDLRENGNEGFLTKEDGHETYLNIHEAMGNNPKSNRFIETSAKTGENVAKGFEGLAESIILSQYSKYLD